LQNSSVKINVLENIECNF